MKVVLDSNVLVAGFAFGGLCRAVIDVCIDSHDLIISEHILSEVHRILIDKLHHTPAMADERVALFRQISKTVLPVNVAANECRDPSDLPVLGTVLAGNADYLVSGDKDLLDLKVFRGCPIFSPREFWESLKSA